MSARTLIRRHPVAAYLALTFCIAWLGSFAAAGPKLLRGEPLEFADSLAMVLPMIIGPCLAAVVLTAMIDGSGGVRSLFQRMFKWRVGAQWYAALLIFPVLILIVLFALGKLVSSSFAPNLFLLGIAAGIVAGFFEEIGWTGYVYPRMQRKYGVLWASIYLGGLHAFWHMVPDYLGASAMRGDFWLVHFLAFAVFVVALRVLIVWIYMNTNSILLAQLMHSSSTGFLLILVPLSLSPAYDTLFYVVYSILLWVVAAIVLMIHGRNLVSKQNPTGATVDNGI